MHAPFARVVAVVRACRPIGLAAWALACLGGSVALALGARGMGRLCRASSPASADVRARAQGIGRRLRLGAIPDVRVHPTLGEPCLCGLSRPVILLPGPWLASARPEMLEAVLAHEMAHARRLDPLANGIQRIVEVVLFFHPGVHWLSRSLRCQRELLADALAVRLTGDPLALARALESVARLRLGPRATRPKGAALGGEDASLLPRIQELLGMTPTRPRPRFWPLAALPSAAALALVAVSLGFAQDPPSSTGAEVDRSAVGRTDEPGGAGTTTPPALRPASRPPRGPEPLMTSFEVRFLHVEPDAWRDGLGGRLRSLESRPDVSAWILDGPAFAGAERLMRGRLATEMVQAPKVSAYNDAHAVIALGPERSDGDTVRVEVSGKRSPRGTLMTVDLRAPISAAGPPSAPVRYQGSCDLPEESSLLLDLGRRERKDKDRTVSTDWLVMITPRRILTEAEENAIELPNARKPAPEASRR